MTHFRWSTERTLILALAIVIAVGIGLFTSEKNGVQNLTISSRHALARDGRRSCQRGILDRHDNAEGWYSAYVARLAQASQGGPEAHVYRQTAAEYLSIAEGLNSRTDPANSVTWPLGSHTHPIGLGTLNCDKAFPLN